MKNVKKQTFAKRIMGLALSVIMVIVVATPVLAESFQNSEVIMRNLVKITTETYRDWQTGAISEITVYWVGQNSEIVVRNPGEFPQFNLAIVLMDDGIFEFGAKGGVEEFVELSDGQRGYNFQSIGFMFPEIELAIIEGELIIGVAGASAGISTQPEPASDTSEISVAIEGHRVNFADQNPVIIGGRTLVPVRGIFETLGFDVEWDEVTRSVTLTDDNYEVIIVVDRATFTTNGENHILDVPAQIINGRTMLPIRLVLESVGYHVGWENETRTVLISAEPLE